MIPRSARPSAADTSRQQILVLRALRWAAALCLTGLGIAAAHTLQHSSEDLPSLLPSCLPVLIALMAWGVGRPSTHRPASRQSIGLVLAGTGSSSLLLLLSWWSLSSTQRIESVDATPVLLCSAALAALGLTLSTDLLLCRRSDFILRRLHLGPESWRPGRPGLRSASTLLGAAALILTPVLVLPLAIPSGIHQTIAAPRTPPPIPTAVSGEVAWTREIGEQVLDVAAGTVGPVLLMADGMVGLDGRDGSTIWSYRSDHFYRPTATWAKEYVITSPNGAYIAFRSRDGQSNNPSEVTVLNTATGQVVTTQVIADHDWPGSAAQSVQLTDNVALLGAKAFSLADGSLLWEVPEAEARSFVYSGPSGHSTLVTGVNCLHEDAISAYIDGYGDEGPLTECSISLIDDTDPSTARTLDGIVGRENEGLTIVGGWIVQYVDDPQNLIDPADESQTPASWPHVDGGQMQAVSLDAVTDSLAGAAPQGPGVVPLGDVAGPEPWSSRSLIALRQSTTYQDAEQYTSRRRAPITALFDPTTGSVTPIAPTEPPWPSRDVTVNSWPTVDLGVPAVIDANPADEGGLSLSRNDGTDPLTITADPALLSAHSHLADLQVICAPGAVVLWAPLRGGFLQEADQDDWLNEHAVLYGLR